MKWYILLLVVGAFAEDFLDVKPVFGYLARSAEWVNKAQQFQINSNQRIVGGSLAALGQFPYQVKEN
jgi:hypothetical protein